jgi:hypothetical protein
MSRFLTLALGAALLLTAVAAAPPNASQPGEPQPGQPPPAPMQAYPQAGSEGPTPAPDPAMLARAKKWFAALQTGKIDRSQLANGANSISDDQIKSVVAEIGNLGTPVSFVQQQAMTQGGISYAVYLLTFGNGKKLNFIFAVDSTGKIAGLRLTPAP